MSYVGYEVDFLPVGNGERSGDAIAARFLKSDGQHETMIIDGGTKESGQALVDHVKKHYSTSHVHHVVNTHPDGDHASGLSVVLEQLTVGNLWMHRPWQHSADICHAFHDGRITDNSLSERIRDALTAAHRLEELAVERGIPIAEPFTGSKIGPFTVLSPTLEAYQSLLPDFRSTPEKKAASADSFSALGSLLKSIVANVVEHWGIETLREGGTTSAENESSAIMVAEIAGRGIILTGDAGLQALTNAISVAPTYGFNLDNLKLVQIPHHGSRNNVSPSILDKLLGPKVAEGITTEKTAIVSASKNSETHPRKVVTNAFNRRGCKVIATKGQSIRSRYQMPDREGWGPVSGIPFHAVVEPYD